MVEGNAATFTVAVAGGTSTAPVTVTYTVGGTATSGTDFTPPSGTLVLATGDASGTIAIATTADSVVDPGETLTVTLATAATAAGTATVAATAAETTIADEGAVTASVTSDGAVTEGATATFTVALSDAVSSAVALSWSTADATAAAGDDYTAVTTGTVTLAASSTASQTLSVTTLDDTLAESAETFTVTLAGVNLPAGVTLGTATATGTIRDDEALEVSVAGSSTVVEGNAAAFTVSVSGGTSTAPVVVTYTVGGTATSADYTAPSGTLTLVAGAASGPLAIATTADSVVDPGETLSVTLTGATTAAGTVTADATAAVTTIADAGTVTVSVTSVGTVTEGSAATFRVTLSGAVSSPVTVSWSTADGTAAGDDYTAVTAGSLTFTAGSTTPQTLSVSTLDDALAESEETFTVTLAGVDLPDGVMLGTATATGRIADNDATAGVTLSVTPATVPEGAGATTVTVTATATGAAHSEPTVLTISVAGATAGADDFEAVTPFELTVPSNALTGTAVFTLQPEDDALAEGPETLAVTGTTGVAGLAVTPTTLTITDDDSAVTEVTLSLSPSRVSEGAGATEVTVTATLPAGQARPAPTVLTLAVRGGSAGAGDFSAAGDFSLAVPAEEAQGSATFTLTPVDDAMHESNETVVVSGTTDATGLAVAAATLRIIDNDAEPTGLKLSLSPRSLPEGAGPTSVSVTATLEGATRTAPTVVSVSVAGDTADGDDFAAVAPFELTIAAASWRKTATFTLEPVDDRVDEEEETLSVAGTTPVPRLPVTGAGLMLTDNDDPPTGVTLAVDPESVPEGAGATAVTVTAALVGSARTVPTVVTVSVAGDTADGDDFAAVAPFELTIPAREPTGTAAFTLAPSDDGWDEPDERIEVAGAAADLPVTGAAVTIEDDDEPPAFVVHDYAFDLPENHDGRRQRRRLGAVSAQDPDGDAVFYRLVTGDGSRFAVGARSGDVLYIGPGEDFESEPARYELTVDARDGYNTAQALAQVVVTVTDVPEAPVAAGDGAETPEDTPETIDVLANDRDPDGDRLRVAAVTAPAHGTATVVSGGVRYVPEPNWHGEDRFDYTVADPGGLTARATVRVKVTSVNDPPVAVDDEAETLEDLPAVVDVLANDTDIDGDPLHVVAVGEAGHGTTAIAGGGVRYASELNWYGTDRFTYTIADPGGLTSTATVTMTVLPVNDAPRAVGVMPDQALEEGGAPMSVELTGYFTDVDGDVLTYTAVSSDETAVTATVSGTTLTIAAVVTGTASVTVTAADVEGLTATQTFGVQVGDVLVRGVVTDALAALGRGHLSSARMTIGRRLETGGGGDMTRMMVAGQQLSLDAWSRMGAGGLEQSHELLFRAATLQQRRAATGPLGTSADPWMLRSGAMHMMGGGPGGGRDRLLQGTDVLLSFGGRGEPEGAGGMGGRWTVWGQGDLQSFRGGPSETSGYDGDLRTGYLGIDARVNERWLAGVAVARSGGTGNWQVGASSGRLETELTVLHPYVRWGGRETAVWALAGIGRGTADNVRNLDGRRGTSPLGLGLGLVEGRRRVATTAGGLEVDLRGEASWARLRTGDGDETVDGLEAGVRRLRTGVEVTLPMGSPGGPQVAPFGALSTRHDGGAGETGVGLEVAGGVRLTSGRLRVEAQGRMLALHTATDYEERGLSVTASIGGGQYESGLTASLRPRWGAPGHGAESLWQDHFQPYAQQAGGDDGGVDARVGYGVRLAGGRLLTPFGGYGRMGASRRLQVGANLGLAGLFGGDLASPLQIEFSGERYGRPGAPADHRISLFGIVTFGARLRPACDAIYAPCGPQPGGPDAPASPRPGPPQPAAPAVEPGERAAAIDNRAAPAR